MTIEEENAFKKLCEDTLPAAIVVNDCGYFLDAHGLMVGSFRISYWNSKINKMVFDVIHDEQGGCLKAAHGFLSKTKHESISREEWERRFNPDDGRRDVIERI